MSETRGTSSIDGTSGTGRANATSGTNGTNGVDGATDPLRPERETRHGEPPALLLSIGDAIPSAEESLVEVRRLANHLQDARERERRLIAREIHDELGHQLTALKIDLVALERELQRSSSSLASRAASMKALFDQVIGSVRRLSSELRPGILDDFGLVAAIEWQAEAFEESTGITAELALEGDDADLEPPLQTAVFRILQESLSNVARHSRADHVQIALRREPELLRLEVRDNGAGFEPRLPREPRCFGLTGMRERVLALGGTFRIDGLPGYGTTVAVALPVAGAARLEPTPAPETWADHSSLPS